MDSGRILIAISDSIERMMLEARLRSAGFVTSSAARVESALNLLVSESYALLITTLQAPGIDGLTLLREARSRDPELEVILLATAPTVEALIAALDYGVYACLRLPMGPGMLEARISAALERRRLRLMRTTILHQLSAQLLQIAEPEQRSYHTHKAGVPPLRIGPLELDPVRRRAHFGQRPLELSHGEFDLLLYLALRDNQVISVEQIARDVMGHVRCSTQEARDLVKARVYRLRRKIEPDPEAPALIISVRGAGYMLTTSA